MKSYCMKIEENKEKSRRFDYSTNAWYTITLSLFYYSLVLLSQDFRQKGVKLSNIIPIQEDSFNLWGEKEFKLGD